MVAYKLDDSEWILTTEMPGASDEDPMLIHDGRVYQPSELDGGPANRVAAWAYVQLKTGDSELAHKKVILAHAYLRQWPEGPQLDPWELSRAAIDWQAGGTPASEQWPRRQDEPQRNELPV